ncbi:PGPGW domain-containing protein [Pseudactinotalea suaedae]|uniref:PGPGW domain-containing protein n=1 Tax=Pseudactinotalea suaedae TaxID=1524924 RepID=UPI0012E2A902|nr:PGPGW domain-containing protein [Pseudactinotalea suaedae]
MAKVRDIALLVLGWVLVVAGLAALVLPGPGLVMVFSGLVILSQHYPWAEKRLRPIEIRAMKGAAESVETVPRIVLSSLFALAIIGCGVLWLLKPAMPPWWPLPEMLWLPGGRGTGSTLVLSGLIAIGLLAWSVRRFHGKPEEVAKIEERAARR